MSDFFQAPPELKNTYHSNRWLKAFLRFKLPKETFTEIESDLIQLGERCAGPYLMLARQAEREKPVHVPFDAWGQRVDEIRVSRAWTDLQDIAAREAMIATGYQRVHGAFSRVVQFAKLYLFHPSSAFFTCPLAMADGAAKVLETYGKDEVHRDALAHLTSTNPTQFWTSGQWMTEKTGGSDVSGTETEARLENGEARLYGTKWFSSATTSAMALALARLPGSPPGSRGLTLFLAKTYLRPGELNHLAVIRLKDKLGTWALPTAELRLQGTIAHQVGERDQGVKTVATMLNITRLYNSICSVGQMARGLELVHDYSNRRRVFGDELSHQPLHQDTFVTEELRHLVGFLLTFELVHLLGKEETHTASNADIEILRLMTPVCKLFTARAAITTASEVVEGFGGVGYCEDSGVPVHLRDSQVFPIWEGATNVLSLDLIRVIEKTAALETLLADLQERWQALAGGGSLKTLAEGGLRQLAEFKAQLQIWKNLDATVKIASGRELALHLGMLHGSALLATWAGAESPSVRDQLKLWLEELTERRMSPWRPISLPQRQRTERLWKNRLNS